MGSLRAILVPCFAALTVLSSAPALAGAEWPLIPPEDRTVMKSFIDPDADAEILMHTIRVEDLYNINAVYTRVDHEVRIKVFTARGAERAGKVEIVYSKGQKVGSIAGRTVRTDGTIVELKKDQIFDRTAIKASGVRVATKTFVMPSVAPGCIVDYRWTETHYSTDALVTLLELQSEFPTRRTDIYLKPLPLAGSDFNFKARYFNVQTPHFVSAKDDFSWAVLPPIPGRREEPDMPPPRQTEPWMVLYYTMGPDAGPNLWKRYSAPILEAVRDRLSVDATVKAAAEQAASGKSTPAQKAAAVDGWCRREIDIVTDDRLGLSETERARFPKNRNPSETLKRRRGTEEDAIFLFIAMCRGLGLDARLAAVGNRSEVFFDQSLEIPGLLSEPCAAVLDGNSWRFYDPTARWLHPGLLRWTIEGNEALVLDADNPLFAKTPLAPPESTATTRTASLRIDKDGSLRGSFSVCFSGHWGASVHEEFDELTADARVKKFREKPPIASREATFDSVRIEGVLDPGGPVVERADVTIPTYARPVGDRLLVPISFFEWQGSPRYPLKERRYPLCFSYPWSTSDTVSIQIPDGFEVESIPPADPLIVRGAASCRTTVAVSSDGREVRFIRDFSFGAGEAIFFTPDQYPNIKKLFDELADRDAATLSLRKKPL